MMFRRSYCDPFHRDMPAACFEPTTLGIAALALGAVGTGLQVVGALNRGSATTSADYYQAQVAANNRKIAEQEAAAATAAGRAKAEAESLKNAARVGAVKTAFAASGIDPNTGSARDVEEGTREIGRLDTETELTNAQIQAYGYESQATNFGAQSGLYAAAGQNAYTSGLIEAGGSLIGGASSLGFRWLGTQGGSTSPGSSPTTGPGTGYTY